MAFWPSIVHALQQILKAPFTEGLWWQLIPLLFLWIILEIYLLRHKKEELGWNSTLGNGITLFWITVGALQALFRSHQFSYTAFVALLPIALYSILLAYISFTHKFGRKTTYLLGLPTIVYFLATCAILWGNQAMPFNQYMLINLACIWLLLFAIRKLALYLLPDMVHETQQLFNKPPEN